LHFISILNPSKSPLPTPTSLGPSGRTHIHSFVHRRAHITAAQEDALARWLPQWSVPWQDTPLDFVQVFGRQAPVVLEIGFGMGETTRQIAQARPDEDFLAIEVFQAGVGALLRQIHEHGLGNIRIIQHDAVEVLQTMIPPASLAGVHIYFPDPWPKKRHHKRRLIQAPFIELLVSRMAPGAYLHCATDWAPYAEHMLAVLSDHPGLQNLHDGFAPRPAWRPQTKFERRGLRLGHASHDLIFAKPRSSHDVS